MDSQAKETLRSILADFSALDYIKPEEIPDIPLYMDQITTFMDEKLKSCKRYPDEKILTKTMINNYTKNSLVPPPVKKKYSKEHLLLLIFVYYFKDFLSINDIKKLFGPISERYFHNEEGVSLTDIYTDIFKLEYSQLNNMTKDIVKRYNVALKTFPDVAEEDQDYFHRFAMICLMSFDVYIKKQLIERMLDDFPETPANKKEKK